MDIYPLQFDCVECATKILSGLALLFEFRQPKCSLHTCSSICV